MKLLDEIMELFWPRKEGDQPFSNKERLMFVGFIVFVLAMLAFGNLINN